VQLNSGAIRRLFDINGKSVRSLEELQDGLFYVASSGAPFKRVTYVTEENGVPLNAGSTRSLAMPTRGETRGRRHINASNGGLIIEDDIYKTESLVSSEPHFFGPTVFNL
jgi:Doublecortin